MKARPGSLLDRYLRPRRDWPVWEMTNRSMLYAELIVRHGVEPVVRHRQQIEAVLDRVEEER